MGKYSSPPPPTQTLAASNCRGLKFACLDLCHICLDACVVLEINLTYTLASKYNCWVINVVNVLCK